MNARKWVAAATTAAGVALAAEAGAVPVGLELMLLVDTSGSSERRPSTLLFAVSRSPKIDRHGAR